MNRRYILSMIALSLAPTSSMKADSPSFDDPLLHVCTFADLEKLAEQRSHLNHQPRATLPDQAPKLSYDDFQRISFRSDHATWRDQSPFYFETFHRGFVQRDRVRIFTVDDDDDDVKEVRYDKSAFQYASPLDGDDFPVDLGHAGLKLVGDVDGVVNDQEMLTFLGASYFRSRSVETVYGTSVRGLGLNTALQQPEEFPCFHAFWIHRPKNRAHKIEILALMDSKMVSGAYRFVFTPGAVESTLDVGATLYFRLTPKKFCVTPLTSMWMWGDGLSGPPKDDRPGVHDGDGLLIRQAGRTQELDDEWTWRAFSRQEYPSVSRFRVEGLKGFGVLQRNRAFFHYDDHNAQYHNRPSVWIAPRENWNDGHVELLELPGAHEGIDNIGAYWVPDAVPVPGKPVHLQYQVSFFAGDYKEQSSVARATSFQLTRDDRKLPTENVSVELVVRFSGAPTDAVSDIESIEIATETIRAEVIDRSVSKTETGDLLAKVKIRFTEDAPAEIALTLRSQGQCLSETFKYLCPHKTPSFCFPAVYTRQE